MHIDFIERKNSVTLYGLYLRKNHPHNKTNFKLIKCIPSYLHLVNQNKESSFK